MLLDSSDFKQFLWNFRKYIILQVKDYDLGFFFLLILFWFGSSSISWFFLLLFLGKLQN